MQRSKQLTTAIMAMIAMTFIAVATTNTSAAEAGEWKQIFDGKTLKGWSGDPKFWSVEDGAITGQTTKEQPTKGNTFAIWEGGEPGDFELKVEFRIFSGNSGIQYRSFRLKNKADQWRIGGYQADFEAGTRYTGICYGEQFRGILSHRGAKSEIGNDHKSKKVGSVGDEKEIAKKIKPKGEWNEYHIIAKGNHFIQKINGVVTTEFVDNDEKMRRAKGLIALQVHAGPPMKVQFRNIRLKESK